MPNGANTYTTYLRTELDPVSRQSYSQLRAIAEETYRDIGQAAARASNLTAAAFGDPRAGQSLRGLQSSSASTFATIRREAASTSAAVSSLQARVAGVRSATIGAVTGATPAQVTTTRAATAANDNLAASQRRVSVAAEQSSGAQRRHATAIASTAAESGKLGRSLTVLGTTLSVVQGPLGPIAGRINAITAAVSTLGTGTLVLAGAATALFAFAGVANVYAEVESRLRPLYTTQEQVNSALRETGRIALATRSALAPTADLYAKLTSAGRDYGLSAAQVSRVTVTASKAATLSGGTAASREAGLYQFSQGLASGKLGGDELRSVLENIPELARAIAQGFKNVDGSIGTTIGQLRKFGAEGQLTTTAVVEALGRSATIIDAKFAKLPKTISSARTEFVTSFTLLTGQIDHTVGVTSTLANAISVAANNLQTLLALGGALAARFILPKLGGFLADLRQAVSYQRTLAAGTVRAVAAGTATPLTPTGIDRAKALTSYNNAAADLNAARQRIAAEQQVVAAIEQEIAASRAAGEADREKARAASANARFEVAAIEQRVTALRAELAQMVENRAAAASNAATFARAAPIVNRPLQAGEQDATRSARITAFTEEQRQAKLQLAQADLRATAAARALAAAEIELEAATTGATGAILTSTQAANASAARGFALLSLTQQQVAATVALEAAKAEAVVVDNAFAAAETRLTAAQIAYNTAARLGTAAVAGVRSAALALSAALGGPVVIALTAVTGALIYMAGQSNAALDALHNFAGGQEELYRRLGITTDKLREQADAARDLALALANAGVAKARAAREDANADLSKSLTAAAQQLAPGQSLGVGRLFEGQQQGRDITALLDIASKLKSGLAISPEGIRQITEIQRRNPDAFTTSGINGALLRFQGASPADTADKLLGTEAARLSLKDAQKVLADTKAELAKPRVEPKPVAPLTPAQILARGTAAASEIDDPRKKALHEFEEKKDKALKSKTLTDDEKVDAIAEATAAYRAQIKALDDRDARAGKRVAAAAAREHAKEEREAAKATREAAAATEKLADLRGRYDDQPKLVDQVRNDQRAFQALVGQQINSTGADGKTVRRAYTATDAAADSARAQGALNKPFADMTKEMDRQLQIQVLTLQGRTAEAEALGRAYTLIDRTGALQEGQYATLLRAADAQEQVNARIADRQRLVSTLSGAVDDVRAATTQFLAELPDGVGRASSNAAKNLLASFKLSSARLLTDNLFGGVQKRIDDLISGKTALQNATTFTAQQATRTGGIVQRFGDVVGATANRIEKVLAGMNAGEVGDAGDVDQPSVTAELGLSQVSVLPLVDELAKGLRSDVSDLLAGKERSYDPERDGDIVVTAQRAATPRPRAQAADGSRLPTLREVYNETGRSIGEKLDQALGTRFIGKLGGKLGDALQGASKGQFASSLVGSVTGLKQSSTGAAIGGGIGGVLSSISKVTSALGPFGQALSPVLGILGGTLGGLLKKTVKGAASITSTEDSSYTGSGKIADGLKGNASAVQQGISAIAEQLGVSTGAFGVSIGKNGDYYHVSGSANGDVSAKHPKIDVLYEGKDEEEAIRVALLNALQDGAIKGISQASQRILASGQDLQKALSKALLIESIPKRLLAATDPVRAAVNDLNTEFGKIIAALNEGKGSAQQYADAQKLYEIERAKVLAEAQKSATSAIDAYLKDMLGGSNSPLNKATVYQNAFADLEKYATDIRAGKAVDQDDFVAATQKAQEASRNRYGSGQAFFNDFDTLRSLLEMARTNVTAGSSASTDPLPGSPFATDSGAQSALDSLKNATVSATQTQTDVLAARLDVLTDAVIGLGNFSASGFSDTSIDLLPGFKTGY